MKKYIYYRISDGYIENFIMYDGVSEYLLPEGYAIEEVKEDDYVGIGFIRNAKNKWTPPATPVKAVTPEEELLAIQTKLAELQAKFDAEQSVLKDNS